MDNLHIAKRLWRIVIGSSLALFFLGAFSLYQVFSIWDVTNEVRVNRMPSVQFLTAANAELANHRMKTYKHLTLTEASKKEAEEMEMKRQFQLVESNLSNYAQLVNNAEADELKSIQSQLVVYHSINTEILTLSRNLFYDSAKSLIYSSSFRKYGELHDSINRLIASNVERSKEVSHKSEVMFRWFVVFTGFSLLTLIIFLFYFGTSIVRNIFEYLKELALSEAKFRAILESSSDANFFLDKDYRILSFNRAASEKATKVYDRSIEKGISFLELLPIEMRMEFKTNFSRALSGEETVKEYQVKSINESIWFRRYYYPVRNKLDEIIGVAINSEDITKQKEDEAKIRSRDNVLSEISFIQSHHIRGPVATLLGLVSIFESSDSQSELNVKIISDIRTTTEKLDHVIRDIVAKTYKL